MRTRTEAVHQAVLLLKAANSEAIRAGHSQIDVEHLLLALLVQDGDAATALTRAGVHLGPAREALAAQERDDQLALGLGHKLTGQPSAPPVPTPYPTQLLPLTPAAQAISWDYRRRGKPDLDLWLLARLIEEPQGPPARPDAQNGTRTPAPSRSSTSRPSSSPPGSWWNPPTKGTRHGWSTKW